MRASSSNRVADLQLSAVIRCGLEVFEIRPLLHPRHVTSDRSVEFKRIDKNFKQLRKEVRHAAASVCPALIHTISHCAEPVILGRALQLSVDKLTGMFMQTMGVGSTSSMALCNVSSASRQELIQPCTHLHVPAKKNYKLAPHSLGSSVTQYMFWTHSRRPCEDVKDARTKRRGICFEEDTKPRQGGHWDTELLHAMRGKTFHALAGNR